MKKIKDLIVPGFLASSAALFISTSCFGIEYLLGGITNSLYFNGLSWAFLGFDIIYLISLIGMIIGTFKNFKNKK